MTFTFSFSFSFGWQTEIKTIRSKKCNIKNCFCDCHIFYSLSIQQLNKNFKKFVASNDNLLLKSIECLKTFILVHFNLCLDDLWTYDRTAVSNSLLERGSNATLEHKVSIAPTFYVRVFRTKLLWNFWRQNFTRKTHAKKRCVNFTDILSACFSYKTALEFLAPKFHTKNARKKRFVNFTDILSAKILKVQKNTVKPSVFFCTFWICESKSCT
jgi:hypothetical protein